MELRTQRELSVSKEALDKFGSFLMKDVRDRTIRHWDMVLSGTMKDEESQRLYSAVAPLSADAKKILSEIVPKIADTSLHTLLQSLDDEDDIEVAISADGGRVESIRDVSDGLAGELYSDQGWFARFSEERHG